MKKFILMSVLLFSFNGWAEELFFSCECERVQSNAILDPNKERNWFQWDDEECIPADNFTAIVDLDKETLRLYQNEALPLIVTDSNYLAKNCEGIDFNIDDEENICYGHVLNRISLKFYSEGPAWYLKNLKGRYRQFSQCEFKKRY